MFSDESRFSLQSDSRRTFIWRAPGTRYHQENTIERPRYGGAGWFVWGGIILGFRTDLHVQSVTMTGHIYRDVILEQHVRLFRGAMGAEFLFMDDNARPHRANIADECLQSEDITRMDWPASSPDLNPIEHVWDMLGRRIAARQPPPTCLPELRRALLDECCNIPQDQIDNLILSMPRCYNRNDPVVYPSGIISAFIGTEVNGDRTTYHTTQLYRTYVDGSYTEILHSTSMISPTPTLNDDRRMESTTNVHRFGSLNSGKVYLTAVNEPRSSISNLESDSGIEVSGTFLPPAGLMSTKHFGLDISATTIGTLYPAKSESSIIVVTGTAGTFVQRGPTADITYPVFTGSYISGLENPTTYKFFFGNHPLTSDVKVILPTASANVFESTERYEAEESGLQGSISRRNDVIEDSLNDGNAYGDLPEPFYVSSNKSEEYYQSLPTMRPDIKPVAVTRYVQPSAYPETEEPVLAVADGNTIGVVGTIRRPNKETTLRGHEGYHRQGRLYNPSATGRRVGQGGATVITDQFFFPGHRIETSVVGDASVAYNRDISNAFYNVDGFSVQDQLRRFVKPSVVKDKRLTRTVGLYGPIYEVDDLSLSHSTSKPSSEENFKTSSSTENESNDEEFTTTLYGFAEFSTRISGTHYIFIPASTRPRTFTPRVTRTSFSSGVSIPPKNPNSSDKDNPEAFFRKPLFGTETREFISQKSMFTSTVKEPVEIQKTMFTSTVMTKQPDDRSRARKFDSAIDTVIAETLPLDLATVYTSANDRTASFNDGRLFLNLQSMKKHSMLNDNSLTLDISEIIDSVEGTEDNIEPTNPTGLVSSITGTEIYDGTTTHWTTLIFGTYIDNTYAHVIESTSSIFFTVSKTASPEETLLTESETSEDRYTSSFPEEKFSMTNLESSTGNKIEILSSLSDLSSKESNYKTMSEDTISATPKLEILTSGFILPGLRSIHAEDSIKVESSQTITPESSVHITSETSTSHITPGVVYADEEEPTTSHNSEETEDDAIHILTDGFILPGAIQPTLSSSILNTDEISREPKVLKSATTDNLLDIVNRRISDISPSIDEESTSTDSSVAATEMVLETTNQQKSTTSSESDTETVSPENETSPSLVLLTGDFILPGMVTDHETKVSTEDKSISNTITDDFILPSTSNLNENLPSTDESNSNPESLSILTDGFILPGVAQSFRSSETHSTTINVLPSSALLTADNFLTEDEDDKNELAGGRSAGNEEKTIILDVDIKPSKSIALSDEKEEVPNDLSENENKRSGKALNIAFHSTDSPNAEEILPSISFPITYFTTSTYFTTYLTEGRRVITSRKETISTVYTDSEELKLAKLNPTETIIMPKIQPTKSIAPSDDLTTFTYFTTFYKDGSKVVSSSVETKSDIFAETSTSSPELQPSLTVLTYPTTYYTTLTYFTTLVQEGSTKIVSNEAVISNVVSPLLGESTKPELISSTETAPLTIKPDSVTPTTYFTTFTYYTTFHKDGTTSVSTNYKTISNILYGTESIASTPTTDALEMTSTDNNFSEESKLATYFTTYTYYTTYLREGNPVVSSREEIVSNVRAIGSASTPYLTSKSKEVTSSPIATTFYTTYTFYTTLLKDGTTTVNTRKETISNILGGSATTSNLPAITRTDSPTIIASTPTVKTYFTTYTYYTTYLRDGSSVISTREDTVTNFVTENPATVTISTPIAPSRSFTTYYTTLTSYYTLFNAGIRSVSTVHSTLTDVVALETASPDLKSTIRESPSLTRYYSTDDILSTISSSSEPVVSKKEDIPSKVTTLENDIKPATIVHAITPILPSDKHDVQPTAAVTKTYYTTYTFFTTFLSRGQPSVSTRLETVTNYVTENILQSRTLTPADSINPTAPTIQSYSTSIQGSVDSSANAEKHFITSNNRPITHYTTYTFFTTLLSEGTSVIQSRTHVVSSVVNNEATKADIEIPSTSNVLISPTKSLPLATSVNTIYTTFTYYTTVFSNESPIIKTRYETSANVITIAATPTATENVMKTTSDLEAAEGELYEKRVHPTPVITYYTTHTYVTTSVDPYGKTNFITRELVASATVKQDLNAVNNLEPSSTQPCCSLSTRYPYTFYTTYTYYTTRFHGDKPIINTRYETLTNVIKAPIQNAATVISSDEAVKKHSITSTYPTILSTKDAASTQILPTPSSNYEPASPRDKISEVVKTHRIYNETESSTPNPKSELEMRILNEIDKSPSPPIVEISSNSSDGNIKLRENTTTASSLSTESNNLLETTTKMQETTELDKITTTVSSATDEGTENTSTNDISVTSEPSENISIVNETTNKTEEIETTTKGTPVETTTTVEIPKRGIFSRRRNRPTYRPRTSFRSSTSSTSSSSTKATERTTTTRAPLSFNRRNSTRLSYRRPSLAPRPNPLQRIRPVRPSLTTPASTTADESTSKRRRRSINRLQSGISGKPLTRKLLFANHEETFEGISKHNDLISSGSNSSPEGRNQENQLGLIRTMESKVVNNGVTTVYGTEIHGTFINGVYAQVAQTKVRIHTDTSNEIDKTPINATPSLNSFRSSETQTNKVGLVSSKLSTAVKDGVTTVYTTNVYGTYIGEVYAHLAQTTSNVIQPTATTQNPHPTGLISSVTRSEDNFGTITLWTTQIYGTFVNNYYAHIASTHSNVFVSPKVSLPVQPLSSFQNNLFTETPFKPPTPTARSVDASKTYKTGLLSSIVSEEERDGTTTQYVTDIYGTYIGEQYAKHAKTSSKIIAPTSTESSRSVGLISTIVSSVVNQNIVTLYKTEIFGTYLGQHYAQLARTSTEYKFLTSETPQPTTTTPIKQKTGFLSSSIVRSEINSGTTTMHINEIYGTYIGNAYAHVAKSTTKVIQPTQVENKGQVVPSTENSQKTGLISSSVKTEVNDGTTTLHISEVHGTFVGNYYAHVARRTSTVLPFTPAPSTPVEPPPPSTTNVKSEGVISSEIKTEVNHGTTTLHTREIHGTFINGFYAHVARSTSNVITPTPTLSTPNTGLISAITSSEINNGILTLHTTEIHGTRINGFYAHIARSTSNIVTSTAAPETSSKILGVISATTSTEINNGDTTLHRTSVIGTEIDGVYVQSVKVTSSVIYATRLYPDAITKTLFETESKAILLGGTAKDDLDTARVNELGNGNQFASLIDDGDLEIKSPLNSGIDLLSPSLNSEITTIESSTEIIPTLAVLSTETYSSTKILESSLPEITTTESAISTTASTLSLEDSTTETNLQSITTEKATKSSRPDDDDDYNDYNDNKTFNDKESVTSKPNSQEQTSPRKNKTPPISSSRTSESNIEYDDYEFDNDYDEFGEKKRNRKVTPSLSSSRFKNTRQSKRKTDAYNDRDYENYDDYDYHEDESSSVKQTKTTSEVSTSKETPSSSIRIRPFTGRGRPTFTTTTRSSTKASYTIQFRRPSRTRNSRAFGHRSDGENDFDDELNSEDDEGDIEASEAVVTTATPQVISFSRRKPFGGNRFQPPSRNAPSTTTSRPLSIGRNRRPFGRSTATSPSPTPSIKDNDPDYEENTTEDDDFDDYDEISDKKDVNRNRNFRSTRRPPSRISRFGERRSASNKRGSFRPREEEETENDDFDSTTPNYRNSRNRINQRKPSRGRYNRNNSQSLKASFNSVSRDEDDDSQSLQPINRLRNNNRNRRPSYNPRTKRLSKTASETQTMKKPYLTVTSVVTTVKTLPIYHGFRTSYATLTTTALDTSIIHPTQYSEVISDDVTKTVFYTKTGYPDGIENLHTTITEVVVTTTSLASVKLVPIKIGFSTRTDTITDIQVLTTLSTLLSVLTPDTPQPTAFPQQFQPNFYPQLGPQNPDFGLVASANSFVTTQIVTSTTVVPIILRGRTILSTLTTTSTAESTVVQTVQVPQVPQPQPNFIPQPYFAFQPLTTLLTLYVTGEHGELKPVVTTVTVPLYQQPVFHTKVARSLQQSLPSEHTLKTADIMDIQLMSSLGRGADRDVDIDTHYDQLLSSGLEEINDLGEIQSTSLKTEPLDSTRISNTPHGIISYDVTTISKGPLTEIYEQKVTVNLDTDESKLKQNEIERSKELYGLESRYSFRKLQQFIEEEPIFRPQRDFTRLRRPPANVVLATAAERRPEVQPTELISPRPRQSPPNRRPPSETSNTGFSNVPRNEFQGTAFARRPVRRPINNNFRPLTERRPFTPSNLDNELRDNPIVPSQPSSAFDDVEKIQDLLSSLQNENRNSNSFNGFVGSPTEAETSNGFRPLNNPPGLRRGPGPAIDDGPAPVPPGFSVRPRRLRITRPVNAEETLNAGLRRVTRIRSPIIEASTVNIENEIKPTTGFISKDSVTVEASKDDDLEGNSHTLPGDILSPAVEEIPNTAGETIASRRTVIRRLKPSFIPGDGSGPRRPLVVRRTRINENLPSSTATESVEEMTPTPSSVSVEENSYAGADNITPDSDSDNLSTSDANDPIKPPVKKVIRLRKPENGETLQTGARRRIVVSRRPGSSDFASSVQGRGPVSDNNLIAENGNLLHNSENDLDGFNRIDPIPNSRSIDALSVLSVYATKTYPITYFTTLTYFTTFLHGPDVNYASRKATFSNVIQQTLNPNLVKIFKSNNGRISPTNGESVIHLASRTLGDTTTIVNLASQQNIYNSEVYQDLNNLALISEMTRSANTPVIKPTSTQNPISLTRTPINAIATLPKTYLTLFTYFYTFFDGTRASTTTRAETMTNVASDTLAYLTESIGTSIDANGHLILGSETRTLYLGSREVEGTTTEVNLGLKTLIKIDGVRNVILEPTQQFQYIAPSRTSQPDSPSATVATYESPKSVVLDSSYSSANELYDTSQQSTSETTPLYSNGLDEASNIVAGPRPVVKVTSVIHKPTGPLRSGVFEPRPGVRVRVRPVVSRRLVPSDLASSFDISFDNNDLSTEYPYEPLASPQYVPPGIHMSVMSTPVLEDAFVTTMLLPSEGVGNDNEIASGAVEIDPSSSGDAAVPTKKKLKVTVRRPQSESISRTHTRFVLPSRFEITSRPRFYVVTRTGALGVVSNTQRPFTVKVSRKLKPTITTDNNLIPPSTTVIYDTFTTLTSVPVIFGLDTSYRNVLLTTSSPITVSFVPTPTFESGTAIAPSTVVLTFFTTTTFTIPYIVGDETVFTTLEETNSRIVTQTLGADSPSYSTVTRTPSFDSFIPTILPITSVEFGFDGPITHTLSSEPKEQITGTPTYEFTTPTSILYETKTFYTTYTFFSTFFAGTDAVVSSSEQVVTNIVTVPITTDIIQPSSIEAEVIGPLTVFDTSVTVLTKTNYNTVTFYATLFSDTSSFVTPIEEVETQLQTITETYTITRTIVPTPSASLEPPVITPTRSLTTEEERSVVVTQTMYTTFTNFVTLFQGTGTVVTNLEETVSNVVTLTVPESAASSFTITPTSSTYEEASETFLLSSFPSYTTREVLSTQTHYLTLFNNGESLLSSIEEVVTTYVTELDGPSSSPSYSPETYLTSSPELILISSQLPSYVFESPSPTETTETETTSEIQTYHPELVPSIRKIYSTLTFYTTYYSDTSSIVASQTEVLTSYVTLFVPPSLISTSTTSTTTTPTETSTTIEPTSTTDPSVYVFTTTDYSTLTLYTTLFSGDEIVVISSEHVVPEVITATITPSSTTPTETTTTNESVLTFLTTFTYYTTRFSGSDPIITSSESVVTQYVTIEAPPSVSSTSEVVIESTPVVETILGVSTAVGSDIASSLGDDMKGMEIIGVSSAVGTGIEVSPSVETKVQVESKIHSEVGSTPLFSIPEIVSSKEKETSSPVDISSSFAPSEGSDTTSISTPVLVSFSSETTAETEDASLAVTSTSIVTKETELIGVDGKKTSLALSDTLILVTGTDGFVTKLAEFDSVALSPVYIPPSKETSPSPSSEIKPATVIELSDLLGGNTALGGDIGLAIQDIVSRITGKKNKTETDEVTTDIPTTELTTEDQRLTTVDEKTTETTPRTTELSDDTTGTEGVETTTESSTEKDLKKDIRMDSKEIDYPVFILPDKSASDQGSSKPKDLAPVYVPTTDETSIPVPAYSVTTETSDENLRSSSKSSSHSVSTSVITGARTVFIVPSKSSKDHDATKDSYSVISETVTKDRTPRIEIIDDTVVDSSMMSSEKSATAETPRLKPSIGTSIISGIRTIFFGSGADKTIPTSEETKTSKTEETVLGRANMEIEKPKTFTTVTKDGKTVVSRTTSGATTIFFPGQIPKHTAPVISTRYITSVESITRTLALTTTRTYYTRDSTLTVPSVYTTTIPPRTFVSTIIGSRTILGILPEPTETIQIHKTQNPSERTTTVTTTTLIFNSIPSTVIRTLVLPTGVPTKTVTSASSSVLSSPEANVFNAGTERPAKPPEVGDSTSLSDENLIKSSEKSDVVNPVQKQRDETYLRAAGPRLYESRPDVILDQSVHRPPIVVTDKPKPEDDPFMNGRNGVCDPKCQPYKKEMCRETKGLWTCQCRPGHARRDSHEICREIQTFVMLLKVVKMGNESVNFSSPLSDIDSDEYKHFVRNVEEGIADAYSITNMRDHLWEAEVNQVLPIDTMQSSVLTQQPTTPASEEEGVLVNLTLKVSKSVSGHLLEQELMRSLQNLGMRVGDSSLLAAPLSQNVQDYDECMDVRQNDCALRAKCINMEGSFTCQCEEGYEDMDRSLPGRVCLAKTENCNYCHGRGDCLRGDDDKTFCRCQPMFVGRRCEINGLVLAVALPTAVAVVVVLLCFVLCCCRKCRKKSPSPNGGDPGSVFRGIALKGPMGGTLDRKAMIDTSSESSGEHGRKGIPFDGYQESGDVTPHKGSRRSDLSLNRSLSTGYTSPPVMIPRAKQPPGQKPMNYTVYDGQVYVW
ncbi:Transposable element Tc3 transposase [Araneus ventricosus]|uniref:Transposable element Tc3 transposase n=1 Tax=Araneus ventricosus TaxID=182803 RepID=A0A4Y2KTU1_ARAVE|nr:Transposable element Tc3 transposase [Araneus ventricosus]